jgi:large subunit ribosomal protein L32
MGLPKRKVSHARQGDRRAHAALVAPRLVECSHCHQPRLPHHACPNCGWYRGRQVLAIKGATPGSESTK